MDVSVVGDDIELFRSWTPVDEDLDGLDRAVREMILRFRLGCCRTDRNRILYYGSAGDVDEFRDIPYIEDGMRAHLLDVYIPHEAVVRAGRSLPVYIDVHGGGFVYGYKELNRNFCIALARRGFAVVSVGYRVFPQADFLGQLQDVNAAINWLSAHAGDYPIDMGRVGITGDSAGACLALFTLAIQGNPGLIDRDGYGFGPTGLRYGFLVSGKYDLGVYAGGGSGVETAEPDMVRVISGDLFGTFLDAADRDLALSLRGLARCGMPPLFLATSSDDFLQCETLVLANELARVPVDFELHDPRPAKGESLGHVFPVGMPWLPESGIVLDRARDFTYEVM